MPELSKDISKQILNGEDFGKEDASAEQLSDTIERMKQEAVEHDSRAEVDEAVDNAGTLGEEERNIVVDIDMLNNLLNRVTREAGFVAKDLAEHNDARAPWLNYSHQLVTDFVTDLINRLEVRAQNGEEHPTIPAAALTAFGPVLANMLAWRPGTAVLGNEEEWEPAGKAYEKMIGQDFWFTEHKAEGTGFTVTSIERNMRMPTLLRFNHDNRYVHRIDAVTYLDSVTGQPVPTYKLKATSIRFVELPYVYQPPVQIYVDPEGNVVEIVGSNGPEFDGRPAPKCVYEAIEKDRELHPELYPDISDEDFEDDREEDGTESDGDYFGLTEEEVLGMVGGEEQPVTPEQAAATDRALNNDTEDA